MWFRRRLVGMCGCRMRFFLLLLRLLELELSVVLHGVDELLEFFVEFHV